MSLPGERTERMQTFEYPQSRRLFDRACEVIPGGIYGHFSPAPLGQTAAFPFFAARAEGARFQDVDGNEFIDYMCAYGPMILGYANRVVDDAFRKQLALADAASIASPKMVELAELLVDRVAAADWAFFAKNGADVTSYAVTIARAATGRRTLVAIQGGYHGTHPWMQAPGHHGIAEDDHRHCIRIPWNDVAALERVVAEHEGGIAGFIATPYHHPTFQDNALPAEGYWRSVETLLRKHGIVFILDDVRCGFRLHRGGSNERYGFTPDLVCFCKALANGYPIAALVGTDALRTVTANVFHTGSYWFSAAPMAAAIATLQELERLDAPSLLDACGRKLNDGLVRIAKSHGFTLRVTGEPCMAYYRITDDESQMLHQRWCAECTRRGAYFTPHHNWFVSTAHSDADLQRTWDIADDAFRALKATA
jgi:glutamate-1-semialdehyde 2,1-aminomutase